MGLIEVRRDRAGLGTMATHRLDSLPTALLIFLLCPCPTTAILLDTTKTDPAYILESPRLPDDDRFRPPIGNGHVATNVLSDTVYVNGLFNGHLTRSHRARIPATSAIDVTLDGTETRHFRLDMWNGVFVQEISHRSVTVTLYYYAHRQFSRLLVTQVEASRVSQGDITLNLTLNEGVPSNDLNITTSDLPESRFRYREGFNLEPETDVMGVTRIFQYCTQLPDALTMEASDDRRTWTFVTSSSTDRADAFAHFGLANRTSASELLQTHVKAWRDTWGRGRVEMTGDLDLARTVHAAMYNILASLPLHDDSITPFVGLSPGGLSRGGVAYPNKTTPYNDYYGHVFWDMDTWIMPPILLFHPDLARLMIGARYRVIDAARAHAQNTSFRGVRFPWEQAVTGVETCPWPPAAEYQLHVTADVSLAIRQYMYAVGLVDDSHVELALEIARFWHSRVQEDDRGEYEITGVMGPDENHFNVNNSVFTNYNAKLSLLLPRDLRLRSSEFSEEERSNFSRVAEKLVILYDEKNKYHPQFEGFKIENDTLLKQSDVVLLGYPLMMSMPKEVRRNDLELYSKLTDRFGPDTGTWSMHTLTWLELGEEQKAAADFRMMLRNINGPFKVFSEKPASGPQGVRCVNFITGAGGLLQAVLFGHGGLRLRHDGLDLNPHLLPNTMRYTLHDLDYQGFRFDLEVTREQMTVRVVSKERRLAVNTEFYVFQADMSSQQIVAEGKSLTMPRQAVRIVVGYIPLTREVTTPQRPRPSCPPSVRSGSMTLLPLLPLTSKMLLTLAFIMS